jgi:hypothetical protein
MKTIKTILKVIGITIVAVFFALFTWANWNAPTPGDKLKPKNYALYDLSNIKDNSIFTKLDDQLEKTTGVLATCLKPADKIISVVFYPDVLTQTDIQNKLSAWSNVKIMPKVLVPHGPTCPVAGMMGRVSALKRFLCIRS